MIVDRTGAISVWAASNVRAMPGRSDVNGPVRQAAIPFVAANGAPIDAVELGLEDESLDRRIYRGPAIKPPADFRLAVSGVDASGFPFQRMESPLSLGEAIWR